MRKKNPGGKLKWPILNPNPSSFGLILIELNSRLNILIIPTIYLLLFTW